MTAMRRFSGDKPEKNRDDKPNRRRESDKTGRSGSYKKRNETGEDTRSDDRRESKPWVNRSNSERKPFSRSSDSERKPWGKENDTERKPWSRDKDTERKPWNKERDSERKPWKKEGDSERKPWSNERGNDRKPRSRDSESERKPWSREKDTERKPWSKDRDSERKPWKKEGDSERKPWSNERDGDRKPRRRDNESERKPWNREKDTERKPWRKEGDSERKPWKKEGDSERKPWSNDRDGDRKPRSRDSESERKPNDTERKPWNKEGDSDRKLWSKDRDNDRKPRSRDSESERKPWKSREGEDSTRKPWDRKSDDSRGKDGYEKRESRFNKDKSSSGKTYKSNIDEDGSVRLNKYIANAGVCSRREADTMILAGAIKVNGITVTELGTKVGPDDKVQIGDETLNPQKKVYLLLNKPKGYITTVEDPEDRNTVMMLIKDACRERVYPVGRLDRNTTGLLLMTNDGEMAKKLTHPSHKVRKIYQVEVNKTFAKSDMIRLTEGIELEDGLMAVDEIAYTGKSEDKKVLGVVIHSGKNRIVRRLFEALDYEVTKLDRVAFANLTKKDLPRGRYRFLTEAEINLLKMI